MPAYRMSDTTRNIPTLCIGALQGRLPARMGDESCSWTSRAYARLHERHMNDIAAVLPGEIVMPFSITSTPRARFHLFVSGSFGLNRVAEPGSRFLEKPVPESRVPGTNGAGGALQARRGETDVDKSHGRFVWYELTTTDVEAAKAFYAEGVGWGTQDVSTSSLDYTLFTAGGASVSGLMRLPEEAAKMGFAPGWLGYVAVDDVDAAADRIKQLGGAVQVPPTDVPNISRFSVAVDPQQATIALFKWLDGGQAQTAQLDARGRVGGHELLADDWEKAWAFYRELFGWQKAAADIGTTGTYQQFSAGGQTIGGMFTKPAIVPVPFWLYYFNTGDID